MLHSQYQKVTEWKREEEVKKKKTRNTKIFSKQMAEIRTEPSNPELLV